MSVLEEVYTLADGNEIPKLGLGTWLVDDDKAAEVVEAAINAGYRNIDTAQAYGNERGVGEGIRASGIPREELFVSTKLAAEIKDYDEAVAAINESLRKLNIGYVDLLLIHCPQPWDDFRGGDYFEGNVEAWRALEEALAAGKARTIGVSNFLEKDLENIFKNSEQTPMVNQIQVHPGETPSELIDYCQDRDILIQAYSPIAHGKILGNPEMSVLAEKYGVSIPQLCLRYALQLGTQPLPKTLNPEHMKENAELDFEISDDDMDVLRALDASD